MKSIEIELTLGEGRCIECATKHEYHSQMMRIMSSDSPPGPGEESRMDLLIDFLESADFGTLRSSSEGLAGITNSRCLLSRAADGFPIVRVIVE